MIFDDLTASERETVEKICTIKRFTCDETVIKEGQEGQSLYIVLSGTVEARKELSGKQYKQLRECAENDFFGDMSFLGASPRSADVVAVDDCEVLELPLDAFEALSAECPGIGLKVYRSVARGLAHRLKKNTEDLKKAVLWAISGMDV